MFFFFSSSILFLSAIQPNSIFIRSSFSTILIGSFNFVYLYSIPFRRKNGKKIKTLRACAAWCCFKGFINNFIWLTPNSTFGWEKLKIWRKWVEKKMRKRREYIHKLKIHRRVFPCSQTHIWTKWKWMDSRIKYLFSYVDTI